MYTLTRRLCVFSILSSALLGWRLALAQAAAPKPAPPEFRLASPDGAVAFTLSFEDAAVRFAVARGRQPVIESSPLVISVDGVDLTRGTVAAGAAERYRIDETYPWRGVHARAVNRCEGARIPLLHEPGGTRYTLDVRAFDDGVAFRHVVPGEAGRSRVPGEDTAFVLPAGSTVWYHGLEGHYEDVHERKDVADISAGEWVAPPLTFKLPDGAGYASITEAALVSYPGMALQADGRRGFRVVLGHAHHVSYPFRLRYEDDSAADPGTVVVPGELPLRVAAHPG